MLKLSRSIFYVKGKALSGELSCPCDRSYSYFSLKPYVVTPHLTVLLGVTMYYFMQNQLKLSLNY